jgi:ribonuclease Z
VTDAAMTPENAARIQALARTADQLFIEAVFLDEDARLAESTHHLTAAAAGELAGRAGARAIVPFHHSARYLDRPDALRLEAETTFRAWTKRSGRQQASR